jgi:hypothetical protein
VLKWQSENKEELPLYAAYEKTAIDVGGVPYRLSKKEKDSLMLKLRKNPRVKKDWITGDALIPLRDLIR